MADMWQQQQQGGGIHKAVRLPALPLPQQTPAMENTCWQVNLNVPELSIKRVAGFYAIPSLGRSSRSGCQETEWMTLNPRHDKQRWSVLDSMIAVLSASRVVTDRTMLEQFEALVQPTHFLEFLGKTMPMSETHLDMVTSMHETMTQSLNTPEVLYKGGQRAVDEFTSSLLRGMEKLKASALAKATPKVPQRYPKPKEAAPWERRRRRCRRRRFRPPGLRFRVRRRI
jgi:hypothetical protein